MFQSRSYTQTSSNLKPAVSTDSTIDNGNVTTSIRLFVIPNGILPAFGSPQILENVFYVFGLTALAGKNLQVTLCRVFKGLNLIADVGHFHDSNVTDVLPPFHRSYECEMANY